MNYVTSTGMTMQDMWIAANYCKANSSRNDVWEEEMDFLKLVPLFPCCLVPMFPLSLAIFMLK